MYRLVILLIVGAAEMAAATAHAQPDRPSSASDSVAGSTDDRDILRLQKAQIIDPQGFGRPMTAFTLLIPAGWKTEGGIIWEQNAGSCGRPGTYIEWRATSADGVSSIELIPEETWSGNNLPIPQPSQECPNMTVTNVKDYLQWFVQRIRPRARILDYRDRPDLTKPVEAQYNRTESNFGVEMRSWIEGGEVLLADERNGIAMRESIAMMVAFQFSRMPGVMPGEIREFLTVSAQPALAVRAPHGQLDFRLTETVRRSIRMDPGWGAEMAAHNRIMAGIAAKGAADRHAIRMETSREIARINNEGYQNQQAALDRGHQETIQSIRGVETYSDPLSSERIELPNTHEHVWRLNDDTYILTDDVDFQPYRDLGVEGHQLESTP